MKKFRVLGFLELSGLGIFLKNTVFFKKAIDKRETVWYNINVVKITYGSVPERPKGADCKSVVSDFGGPNPPAPTRKTDKF